MVQISIFLLHTDEKSDKIELDTFEERCVFHYEDRIISGNL